MCETERNLRAILSGDTEPDGNLEFEGWFSEEEKETTTDPWERFRVCLFAEEAGDLVEGEDMLRALRASGYELTLRKLR